MGGDSESDDVVDYMSMWIAVTAYRLTVHASASLLGTSNEHPSLSQVISSLSDEFKAPPTRCRVNPPSSSLPVAASTRSQLTTDCSTSHLL